MSSSKTRKIAVIGMGYVGLTIATGFAKKRPLLGYDISKQRISELKQGYDKNNEISSSELQNPNLIYTTNESDLNDVDFYIISVLTPIDADHRPDLRILLNATEMVGKYLKPNDIVVYESTIYPGGTEEHCIPLLEKASKLKCGKDFGVGYSPERINPADKEHRLDNIPKIISANNQQTLAVISEVYKDIVASIYPVSKISVAEAVKIIENTQRDLNISIMNEFAVLLHKLDIDSKEVFSAAQTKWNFAPFQPGLVGGHCIGVNTYYLIYRAEQVGYYPELILTGRRVNESMPNFIASNVIKELIKLGINIKKARIAVLGLTYKENMPDLNFSKAQPTIKELSSYQTNIYINDAISNAEQIKLLYKESQISLADLKDMDAVVIMVPHQEYVDFGSTNFKKMFRKKGLLVDVKGFLNKEDFDNSNVVLWRL